MRIHLHPRDMTPEERFELITDIFAEAFIEIRLAEIVSQMKAEGIASESDEFGRHAESFLEVSTKQSPDGLRNR